MDLRPSRRNTCELLELVYNGSIDWETLARDCLNFMSDDEVGDMAVQEGYFEEEEDKDENDYHGDW